MIFCFSLQEAFCFFSFFNRIWCSDNTLYLILYNERRYYHQNLANVSVPLKTKLGVCSKSLSNSV